MAVEAERDLRMVLLGPPGSGKGTQATLLAERFAVPAISTGEMLRQAVSAGTELGRRIGSILARGELVDDPTMAEVVEERLKRSDADHGFLLDGFPRTVAQAETLERILDGTHLDVAMLIRVPEQELLKRSLARGREDDTPEVIRDRFSVYGNKTEPLIGYYRERNLLREVDGDRPIAAVHAAIVELLGG